MTLVSLALPGPVWREDRVGSTTGREEMEETEIHSSTAVTIASSSSSPAGGENTVVKDENGQDICCVVCGDKSSGKHYGQFTCEGRNSVLELQRNLNIISKHIILWDEYIEFGPTIICHRNLESLCSIHHHLKAICH